jgi:hypothetical protein
MTQEEYTFEEVLYTSICESVEGDKSFIGDLVAAAVDSLSRLRRVRASEGLAIDGLARDAASALTKLVGTVLEEVDPKMEGGQ